MATLLFTYKKSSLFQLVIFIKQVKLERFYVLFIHIKNNYYLNYCLQIISQFTGEKEYILLTNTYF